MISICNFTSLFEIYCTFNLAYILIDQIGDLNSENKHSYIPIITEKILQKYKGLKKTVSDMRSQVIGLRTSIEELKPKITEPEYNESASNLDFWDQKLTKHEEIFNAKVILSYRTKSFSYNCAFLFLFCIGILIYSGVVTGRDDVGKYDTVLMFYIAFALIFLLFGWAYDEDGDKKSKAHNLISWCSNHFEANGYKVAIWFFICSIVLSSILGYVIPTTFSSYYVSYHNTLVVLCLLLPVMNFIFYFLKASKRASENFIYFKPDIDAMKSSFDSEMSPIQDCISAYSYFETRNGLGRPQVS
jgi:hypothetical protein